MLSTNIVISLHFILRHRASSKLDNIALSQRILDDTGGGYMTGGGHPSHHDVNNVNNDTNNASG